MQTLDSPEVEAERAMLVPATPTWFGRKPDHAQPFTDTAIRAWVRSGALTPPTDHRPKAERIASYLSGAGAIAFIAVLGLMFTYPLWSR